MAPHNRQDEIAEKYEHFSRLNIQDMDTILVRQLTNASTQYTSSSYILEQYRNKFGDEISDDHLSQLIELEKTNADAAGGEG